MLTSSKMITFMCVFVEQTKSLLWPPGSGAIFGQNLWESRFWWKFSKNLAFGQNFSKFSTLFKINKISFLVIIYGNPNLVTISKKITILLKIVEQSRFWSQFLKNLVFGKNLRKSRFWPKIFNKLDLGQNFRKISNLVKIVGNFDFGKKLRESRFWSKFSKISILVKIFDSPEFGQYFRKISGFFLNSRKNLDFDQNLQKS